MKSVGRLGLLVLLGGCDVPPATQSTAPIVMSDPVEPAPNTLSTSVDALEAEQPARSQTTEETAEDEFVLVRDVAWTTPNRRGNRRRVRRLGLWLDGYAERSQERWDRPAPPDDPFDDEFFDDDDDECPGTP